jgi:hypothetical protein
LCKGASYGKATTHYEKLWPKIEGCPVLTFAIRPILFVDDGPEAFERLKARIASEKAARQAAKRRGEFVEGDDDDEA